MATHTSATKREETPHINNSNNNTISNALKRRAQSVIKDNSLDPQIRAIIRYALEINDPWLVELVRRADAGETIAEMMDALQTGETTDEEKIEVLAGILCRPGDEPETKSASLLVLMGIVENAACPKALANTAKHLAFTRCGELNIYGMVDTQIAIIEHRLLDGSVQRY